VAELTYLPEVECVIDVANGLFDSVVVGVPDEAGNKQFLRVPRDYISESNGKTYLPIGLVEVDPRRKRALVELPSEAASGVRRLWVPFASFRPGRNNAHDSL
jgi:hypothetical protein